MDSGLRNLILVIVGIVILYMVNLKSPTESHSTLKLAMDFSENEGYDYLIQPDTNWAPYKESVAVKGIYLSGSTVGNRERFLEIINFIDSTELNAVVIDIKDDWGNLTCDLGPQFSNATYDNFKIDNIDEVINLLREKDIYPIARIVTFKDNTMANIRPDLAIKSIDGGLWTDNSGNSWLNPYDERSWKYPVKVAEAAACKGFKEIQFDYIRFPTDGKRELIDYGNTGNKPMAEAIGEFLKYASETLEPLGVNVSADIFGIVTTEEEDIGIGQHLETIAKNVDIISPMVYPSHYSMGSYGVMYPDSEPYKIIYKSLYTAKSRIEKIDSKEKTAAIRPWLQDFSAPWLKSQYGSNYTPYGPKQIRQQIEACHDCGIDEWMFWNGRSIYTIDGFEVDTLN